ncbi:hypothetical protein [Mesorhizobium sp. 128a]
MLLVITSHNADECQAELDQAFRLRHKVFVEEKGCATPAVRGAAADRR